MLSFPKKLMNVNSVFFLKKGTVLSCLCTKNHGLEPETSSRKPAESAETTHSASIGWLRTFFWYDISYNYSMSF